MIVHMTLLMAFALYTYYLHDPREPTFNNAQLDVNNFNQGTDILAVIVLILLLRKMRFDDNNNNLCFEPHNETVFLGPQVRAREFSPYAHPQLCHLVVECHRRGELWDLRLFGHTDRCQQHEPAGGNRVTPALVQDALLPQG
jgi:hypothetical protein